MSTTSGGPLMTRSPRQENAEYEAELSLAVSDSNQETSTEHAGDSTEPKITEPTSFIDQGSLRTELSRQYHQTSTELDLIQARNMAMERNLSFHDSRATFLETYRGHHGDGRSRVIINAQSSDDLGHTRLLMHFSEITRTLGISAMSGLKTSFNELEALEKEVDGWIRKFKAVEFEPVLTAEEVEHLRGLEHFLHLTRQRRNAILVLVRSYW
ncbi:hypothetical protein D6C90_09695 [Aureobasidium pullulans]|uniref:Uncharacterized protein n=1 Tax=Aureobasidium pullulans TaxID=5580 RepID=A0A4S9T716_AURPU|nr:hypothetical protein D6C90_09695 [Aureobasidium pullulans]